MTTIASKLTQAKTLSVVDAEQPTTIPEGSVLIKIEIAGICGTDMHYFNHFENAGFKLNRPLTLGHEACGRIIDSNGSNLKQGQLVALNPIIACDVCDFCKAGKPNLCISKKFPGSATTVPHIDGFFQTHITFPEKCCIPVKESTKAEHLAFAEPLACSMHSANQANIKPGDKVLVTGCGPMGLLAVIAALSKGALVTCLDIKAQSVELGQTLGAELGLVIGQFNDDDYLNTFDAVIEASGSINAFNFALESVKKGGAISILSNVQPSNTPANLNKIMLKELTIVGSFQFNREFEESIDVIESGDFNFDQLIAKQYALGDISDAFSLATGGSAIGKVQIVMPK